MYAVAEPWPLDYAEAARDDHWLARELDRIWSAFFPEIPRVNALQVCFARHWRARLGLITLSHDKRTTYIGINAYLRDPEVPGFVPSTTLAHEIAHYAHGFGSPLPQKYKHPHRGGVVTKELATRGLAADQRAHQQWIHDHWHELCASRPRLLTRR